MFKYLNLIFIFEPKIQMNLFILIQLDFFFRFSFFFVTNIVAVGDSCIRDQN